MLCFCFNLVVEGSVVFVEDGWKCICIGLVEFVVVKFCFCCIFIILDLVIGECNEDCELLMILKIYWEKDGVVLFG